MASSSSASMKRRIYAGTFIHTPTLGELCVLEDARVGVNEEGVIEWIERRKQGKEPGGEDGAEELVEGRKWGDGEMETVEVEGGDDGYGWYFPGFVGRFFPFYFFFFFSISFFWDSGLFSVLGFGAMLLYCCVFLRSRFDM